MLKSEADRLSIVVIGLSLTSSWGNGHATTYRSLIKGLHALGHSVLFLEHDVPWYARHRDFKAWPFSRIELYQSIQDLKTNFTDAIRSADLVIVGSYVVKGTEVIDWVVNEAENVTAFYDIDTPVTLSKLAAGDFEYLKDEQIPYFDLYLSFTGGPLLEKLETEYYANNARALFCSVDEEKYFPERTEKNWDLGYLGTYSADRQHSLEKFILQSASEWQEGRFVVAGPQFPEEIAWPNNVSRTDHIPPEQHRRFYNQQRFTLNVTRLDMIRTGYAPSVRLFEAAACGVPIISDFWKGLDSIFEFDSEILIARNTKDVIGYIKEMSDERRTEIGNAARVKVLQKHTSVKRAEELVGYYKEIMQALPYKTTAQLLREYNEIRP